MKKLHGEINQYIEEGGVPKDLETVKRIAIYAQEEVFEKIKKKLKDLMDEQGDPEVYEFYIQDLNIKELLGEE